MGLGTELKTDYTAKFPSKIFYKNTLFQGVLILLALCFFYLLIRNNFEKQFLGQTQKQLINTLNVIKMNLPEKIDQTVCQNFSKASELRITIIDMSGKVLCDSEKEPHTIENYNDREEIIEARKSLYGLARRKSASLGLDMLYGALKVSSSFIIRSAIDLKTLSKTISFYDKTVFISVLIIFSILLLGMFLSIRQLFFPLGRILLKARNIMSSNYQELVEPSKEMSNELSDFEDAIDVIHRTLAKQSKTTQLEKKQLETIMGAISDAIIAVNSAGEIMFFNILSEMIFSNPKLREPNSKIWEVSRHPTILKAFRFTLNNGRRFETKALELNIKSSPLKTYKRYFNLTVSPLLHEDGSVYGAVGIFHDITEMKAAEQMRIDFVANVSHELRTPLTSIKGYAETIKEDIKKGKTISEEFVDVILRNSERLMALLADLLDLSSIESADVIKRERVNIEELTNKVIGQLKESFSKKKQIINTKIQTNNIFADPDRLEQVMVNLLTNANKYTQEGGKISVIWYVEKNETFLKVSDNGPGIPAEHQTRLFERFYRLDKARSREEGGTGLGLAIVKHIMQKHGGKVWVESTSHEGSTFICQFPSAE